MLDLTNIRIFGGIYYFNIGTLCWSFTKDEVLRYFLIFARRIEERLILAHTIPTIASQINIRLYLENGRFIIKS